ncbi:hypothetical protein [Nonomuraea sp. NPDC050202]|uniref:hypothetical protein n=1 Tax=Nonomuraea sp. NPDC050202 TaxID=3155035 RepID=UPI00340B9480
METGPPPLGPVTPPEQRVLDQIPGLADSDFTARAPLATVRADLVERLAGQERTTPERLRAQPADFVNRVLGTI